VDTDLAVKGAELRHGHGFSLADATIAATALREGCPVISADHHFSEVEGLKRRWIA
jgi:predicted nucleic acid-binding protein